MQKFIEITAAPSTSPTKGARSAMHRVSSMAIILFGITACDMAGSSAERWYSDQQVKSGQTVFAQHCAVCHGKQAEGRIAEWKTRLADGSYPPPPLNGSAHAWHHSMPLLLEIVQKGGMLYNGKMPGFADKLSETDQYAVIAWFQNLWSDETYRLWQQGNRLLKQSSIPAQGNSGDW